MQNFHYCSAELFLCIVCKVFLSVVCQCSHSSFGALQELDEVVSSEVFLVWSILALLGQYRTMVVVLAPGMVGGLKALH